MISNLMFRFTVQVHFHIIHSRYYGQVFGTLVFLISAELQEVHLCNSDVLPGKFNVSQLCFLIMKMNA
jgi:hypothetical protein